MSCFSRCEKVDQNPLRDDGNPLGLDSFVIVSESPQSSRIGRIGCDIDDLRTILKRAHHLRSYKTSPCITCLCSENPIELNGMADRLMNLKGQLGIVEYQGGGF